MSVTILDGGMGQELLARSAAPPTPLWATQVMLDRPELVREVHDAYFAAGAEIATTNTYALHRDRLAATGLEDRFQYLHSLACEAAVAARDSHGRGLVAGSLGPLGWSYTADNIPRAAEAAPLYSEICAIQAAHVDLFLIETMSSVDQARGALMGAVGHGKPVWLGLSVDDADGTRLRSGEPLTDILPVVEDLRPDALLLNCSIPEAVTQGLERLQNAPLRLGAYANGFTSIPDGFRRRGSTVALLAARTDMPPDVYAEFAQEWVALGAGIVGGCCEIGPDHIAELARRLKGDAE